MIKPFFFFASYNYTREDEEVYKEIMEIAGELIPQAMRTDPNVNEDRECFMDLIRLLKYVFLLARLSDILMNDTESIRDKMLQLEFAVENSLVLSAVA